MGNTLIKMLQVVRMELIQRGYNEEDSLLLHVESAITEAEKEVEEISCS